MPTSAAMGGIPRLSHRIADTRGQRLRHLRVYLSDYWDRRFGEFCPHRLRSACYASHFRSTDTPNGQNAYCGRHSQ